MGGGRDYAVGEFARRQGAEAPDRTVAAAKSWLCHSRVDRRQPILPWNAPAEVPKVSPVEASRRYLEHLVAAWEAAHPDAPLAEQCVVLTVPASFDASARELTREAALAAGLPADLVLLEEPQAAVYAWLAATGDRWRRRSRWATRCWCATSAAARPTLRSSPSPKSMANWFCGGSPSATTCWSAATTWTSPWHILAGRVRRKGGEARSLAIGRPVARLPRGERDAPHAAGPEAHHISVLGRGRKLIGGTVSAVDRNGRERLLIEGFFPNASRPTGRGGSGPAVFARWACRSRPTRP